MALLDIDGPAFGLALEVGVRVAHDDPVRDLERLDGGVERTSPDGRPRAGLAQPEEELVPAFADGEGQRPDLLDPGPPRPVQLDQLLHAG